MFPPFGVGPEPLWREIDFTSMRYWSDIYKTIVANLQAKA